MSWGMVVSAGVGLAGSMMQGDAAGGAADAQVGATREQTAEYRRQFDAVQKLLQPYVQTGTDALSQTRQLLGLGGLPSGGISSSGLTAEQFRERLLPQFTSQAATPGKKVAYHEADDTGQYTVYTDGTRVDRWSAPEATTQSTVDEAGLNTAIEQAMAQQQAQSQAGMGSADEQQAAAIAKFENSPYFQAIVKQSEDAMLQNASATGGLRGGNTQDALSKNRPILLQGLIDKQLANLAGLTSQGQNAAAGVGNAGIQTGQLVGNAIGQGGAATAGGILGQSNANIGALGNIGGLFASQGGMSNPFGNLAGIQGQFSQTRVGGSGFGTGLAYGNQDMGAFL